MAFISGHSKDIPWWLISAGAAGLIPGSERSPGAGRGNLLKYSCLEKPMNRGDWWTTVHRVAKSRMTERLSRPTL